jgi:anti-sigma regulatory factor (Ser/Thr protein kinase)
MLVTQVLHVSGAQAAAVRSARVTARDRALVAGAQPAVADDVAVVVSELVSNAVSATSGPVAVSLTVWGTILRIEVTDDGPGRPQLRAGSDRGGFGLHIVERLALAWGWHEEATAKTVWADMGLD